MRAVNLLPVEARAGRRRPPTTAIAVAGFGVLATSLLVFGFVSANGKVGSREDELTRLEQQVAASRRAAEPKPDQSGISAERDQRFTALNDAMAQRLAWDSVLRDVSLVLPEDVWLSNLVAGGGSAPGAPESATPSATTITFTGFTYSQESVARLLSRLALVPNLSNVKLTTSKVTEIGSQQIYNFTILTDVASGGGSP